MTQQYNYIQNDSIDDLVQTLNTELCKVLSRFDSNKLTLDVNKTQIMFSWKRSLTPHDEVILQYEVE